CTDDVACDNMCGEHIGLDEHGCRKLEWPGCNSTDPAPPACSYPVVLRDPRCPLYYSTAYANQPCPAVGLLCGYRAESAPPQAPDCSDYESLWCVGEAGLPYTDGGVDAPGTWAVYEN